MDFKERVRNSIIQGAIIYKEVFVDYDYLIYSDKFSKKPYYVISAAEDNYPHLTGINPLLPARDFYYKCLSGTLHSSDFNFEIKNSSEKSVKGTVRRKIKTLQLLSTLFDRNLQAEEDFSKGKVNCTLGTTDNSLTIGFIDSTALRPKTLLTNNQLNAGKSVDITLILRRTRGSKKFDTVIQSDIKRFQDAYPDIVGIVHIL